MNEGKKKEKKKMFMLFCLLTQTKRDLSHIEV